MSEILEAIPGALDLVEWFGGWPTFHDAEVPSLELQRTGPCTVRIHTFEVVDQRATRGPVMFTKHVVVSFIFEDVKAVRLEGFNSQNVVDGIVLRSGDAGYELDIKASYGLEGTITASRLRVEFEPGIPPDSQYLHAAK